MKEKSSSNKLPKNISLKTSTSNLFLNIIIIVLSVLIIFLVYSLIIKIDRTDEAAIEGNNKTASAIVQLEVLNGCGASGVAEKFTDYLRQSNFDVVLIGNYRSFDIDKSMVIDRTGNKANAIKVAEALGIDKTNIIQQINNDYFLDVSLVIGKDYSQLKPIK